LDPWLPDEQREDPAGHAHRPHLPRGLFVVFAALQLRELGFDATDVIGGVEAWKAATLPVLGQADHVVGDANEAVAG
jgi:hypothetical protein